MADMQINIDDPDILEDLVIGTLKQLRDVHDEFRLRMIWRGSSDAPFEKRVLNLLCNNGPEYQVIINTVEAARVRFAQS